MNMRGLILAAALLLPMPSWSQELDPAIVAAAKQEGSVVWYTTQIVDQFARPAAAAFEKKYGIHVDYVRADSAAVALRLLNEGNARQVHADVFDGTAGVAALKGRGLVLKYLPPAAASLSPQYRDPDGYWAATNLYVLTPGYNTEAIPPAEAPKTFEDLLDPKYKDRIAWNISPSSSAAPGFIGLILHTMGEENGRAYLTRLAKQNVLGVQASARQVLDQVIAGEADIALNIFNTHAVISAAKGAPVAWIPMQPVMVTLSALAITAAAPHPNAGKLLMNFLLSEDGQKLYRAANYIPVLDSVKPEDPTVRPDGVNVKAYFVGPEQIDALMPHWVATFKEIFKG